MKNEQNTEYEPNKEISNDTIKFGDYIKKSFNIYIQTDCVRYNEQKEIKYLYINKPFIEYKPFEVKKIYKKKWSIEEKNDKELKINENSIVLSETKLSASNNVTYIKFDEYIEKNKIQKFLFYYSLLKKFHFIKNYLKMYI